MTTNVNATAPTLNDAIDRALESLATYNPESDTYATVVDQLTKLYQMKKIENDCALKHKELIIQENKVLEEIVLDGKNLHLKDRELDQKQEELDNFNRVSMTTWATIGANIIGIVAIMSHERTHIIATKALGFVSKLK